MKIALAMIVKNTNEEALLLQRCLENMSPYMDCVFVTCTVKQGDKPLNSIKNVVKASKGVLSEFTWVNDFSEARNFNFSQVPKEYDWIMWSDADDVWKGLNKLRNTMELHASVDGFGFWYLYDWDEYRKPTVVHRKTMIIRNDGCTKWVGKLHEDLEPNRATEVHLVDGISRLHLSSPERAKDNAKRNVEIAMGQMKESPDDPRSYWNLANSQFAVSDFHKAKSTFEQFIDNSESQEEIYLAHLRLADVYKSLGNQKMCISELQTAIGIYPSLPDAYFQLSYNLFNFGDLDKAEEYCLQGMIKRPQIMKMVVYNPRDYDYNPMMLLAKIYYHKSRPDLMLPLLKGCLKIYPDDKKLKKMVKDGEKEKKMLGEALEKVQELQKIKDKVKLKKELDKLPEDLRSHPAIAVIRNTNFVKEKSSGKDLVIYCGNTVHQWNPELFKTKGFGGSEEAVIHLAREYAKQGWEVTVYNNCGHKSVNEIFTDKGVIKNTPKPKDMDTTVDIQVYQVTYKPFWEWNYRDKQDVVILWRWAKPLDAEINAPKIFLDLHDVIPEGELNEKRMARVTKVFVKTKFHRSLFPNVPDNKFAVVPNGMELYLDKNIEKDPYLIINTSSPDRSLDVLPKLFKAIKKRVPKAKCAWAYGWDNFVNTYSGDAKKMEWKEQIQREMKEAGIEDLGRLSQQEVGKLYQRASVFAYPTEFAEIDCISVKKAQAVDCYPVTTDFGALSESNKFGIAVHSEKTKDNWNKPYQFHFGLEDESLQDIYVEMVVSYLKGKPMLPIKDQGKDIWLSQFKWEEVAKKWNNQFI